MGVHSIYGLRLRSPIEFPELSVASGSPDVELKLESFDPERPPEVSGSSWYRATPDEVTLAWEDFGTVRIQKGALILADPLPGVDEGWLRSTVLGPVLSQVLFQRGVFPLHASSVALEQAGGAVSFAGDSGAGKSTLGAAFVRRGLPFVADDVTAVQLDDGAAVALPGALQMKLAVDASECLGEDLALLPRVHEHEEKRARPVEAEPNAAPVPLRGVYVLEFGTSFRVERLSPQAAFTMALKLGHRVEWMQAASPAHHLQMCSAFAERVPVFRLVRPRGLVHVDRVVDGILEHAGSLA